MSGREKLNLDEVPNRTQEDILKDALAAKKKHAKDGFDQHTLTSQQVLDLQSGLKISHDPFHLSPMLFAEPAHLELAAGSKIPLGHIVERLTRSKVSAFRRKLMEKHRK